MFNIMPILLKNILVKDQCQPLGQGDIGHYDEQQTNTI